MKINTITCHDVYNLGASLQAYALQTYLEECGHEVRIIDYKPPYLSGHYKLWGVANPVFDKPILRFAYNIAKLPYRLAGLKRKKVFDDFTQRYLRLTPRYHSNEELKRNPPEANAFIAGSDQIWNTLFPNGRDAAFYLDFVPKGKRRISYAASFATSSVEDRFRPFVESALQGLHKVSIRERISLPLLASLGRKDGVAVCDPVFLLPANEWEELIKPENNSVVQDKYVLVYDFEHSPQVRDIARRIAQEWECKIFSVGAFREKYATKNFVNAGPLDFLALMKNARFVISNSFHATAFSLIFRRPFCVVNRSDGINERMKSLLEDYGLEKRIVADYNSSLFDDVDWHQMQDALDKDIACSKSFLEDALTCSLPSEELTASTD